MNKSPPYDDSLNSIDEWRKKWTLAYEHHFVLHSKNNFSCAYHNRLEKGGYVQRGAEGFCARLMSTLSVVSDDILEMPPKRTLRKPST